MEEDGGRCSWKMEDDALGRWKKMKEDGLKQWFLMVAVEKFHHGTDRLQVET